MTHRHAREEYRVCGYQWCWMNRLALQQEGEVLSVLPTYEDEGSVRNVKEMAVRRVRPDK